MKALPQKAQGGIDDLFDRAARRASEKHARMIPPEPAEPPSREVVELREKVLRLENLLDAVLTSLNSATIECAEGSVTLTLPDLPEAP